MGETDAYRIQQIVDNGNAVQISLIEDVQTEPLSQKQLIVENVAKKLDEDDFRRIKELKLKYEPKPIHPEVFSYRLRSYIEDN